MSIDFPDDSTTYVDDNGVTWNKVGDVWRAETGAVLKTDNNTSTFGFVVDEDDMVSNSSVKIPTQQSVKAYVDAIALGDIEVGPPINYIQDTTPEGASDDALWLDTTDFSLYFYYNDGDSSQWVAISGPQGPAGEDGGNGTTDYNELSNKPTLGTAAAANTGDFATSTQGGKADAAAPQATTAVVCVWDGEEWETLSGGAVPTSDALVRHYNSQNDPEADPPTAYSVFDQWFGVSS